MVHKFACVYLKTKPNKFSKGALYRKMMQYGFKLSTKHPSETNNNFEKILFKINQYFGKNKTFNYIPIKIKIICNKNNIGLKYFADIRFGMILVKIARQKWKILRNENSALYSK